MEISFIYPVVFWVFAVSAIIQIAYFWLIFSRFAFYKERKKVSPDIPVSVIICAKNEYHNLKEYLPLILNQDYPDFEVVVVNDASDDETIFFLEDMERKYGNLKIITLMITKRNPCKSRFPTMKISIDIDCCICKILFLKVVP